MQLMYILWIQMDKVMYKWTEDEALMIDRFGNDIEKINSLLLQIKNRKDNKKYNNKCEQCMEEIQIITNQFRNIYTIYIKNNKSDNAVIKNYYKNSLKKLYVEINVVTKEVSKDIEDRKKNNTIQYAKISKNQIAKSNIKINNKKEIQTSLINIEEQNLEQQKEEIFKLEKSVNEINKSFNDMDMLINLQEEEIIQVEEEVEKAVEEIKGGEEDLNKASSYQDTSRKRLCYLLVILVI